jgi:hypothetical protein
MRTIVTSLTIAALACTAMAAEPPCDASAQPEPKAASAPLPEDGSGMYRLTLVRAAGPQGAPRWSCG